MRIKTKENKKKKIILLVIISMILLVVIFLFYRNFHDQSYRENKCVEDVSVKMKTYFNETGHAPEEVILEMFYDDCMRDAGWLK